MDNLKDIIPSEWRYEICHKHYHGGDFKKLEVKLRVALFSSQEIKLWIKALEDKTLTSYSIKSTDKCTGRRVEFKQRLHCCHHTRHRDTYKTGVKHLTRNTNCPSSLNIILKPIDAASNPEMPCHITFIPTHNHIVGTADSVRFRRVCEDTKQKLTDLFHSRHSPATALECLKFEIQLRHDNFEKMLADRSICPGYNYCYHLFKTVLEKDFGPVDFEDKNGSFLIEKLEEYNAKIGEECALFHIEDSNYVIALCPPLFKRIHQNIDGASEIVLMDSTAIMDRDHKGSKMYILLTHSQYGGLPLGILITSSENAQNIAMGCQMLKTMLGDSIFHGHPEGPLSFMTDDSEAEQIAIQSVWKKTKCLLSIFHVLQAVCRWLSSSKNGIREDCVSKFFQQFRSILYAPTVTECEQKYNLAIESAENFPNYVQLLRTYWQKKELWALSYRASPLVGGNHKNEISEAAMRFLKGKILNRVKTFNVCQLVDFLMSKFVDYHTRRLLDAANDRSLKDKLVQTIRLPPSDVLQKIQKLGEHIYVVPSDKEDNSRYIVYADVLVCTCFAGSAGKICKHIDWVQMIYHPEACQTNTDNVEIRSAFLKIATGKSSTETHDESVGKNGPVPVECGKGPVPVECGKGPVPVECGKGPVPVECGKGPVPVECGKGPVPVECGNGPVPVECGSSPVPVKRGSSPSPDTLQVLSSDEEEEMLGEEEKNALVDGQKALREIAERFNVFLKQSPVEAAAALKTMLNNANKLRSLSEMVSSCVTFGAAASQRKILIRRIPVESMAILTRRIDLARKQSRIRERPRKRSE